MAGKAEGKKLKIKNSLFLKGRGGRSENQNHMNKKAVLLLSGGLDSILAGKIMKDQGIDLLAIHFTTIFNASGDDRMREKKISKMADAIGIKVEFVDISEELLSLVRKPRFGYGSSVNPCIDCHLFMFRKAFEIGKKIGASFIVTGEVLGERPMSQRKEALNIIDRNSGLDGLILRPLSAKVLPETLPEKEKIVDREKLYSIQGRGRTEQIKLAEKFGIEDYPSPGGGCLLTDKIFGQKVRDLIEHRADNIENMALLKYGKHFRLSKNTKVILGRDEKENNRLLSLAKDNDIIFETVDIAGPVGLLIGEDAGNLIEPAAELVSRYSDNPKKEAIKIEYWLKNSENKKTIFAKPPEESFAEKAKIG